MLRDYHDSVFINCPFDNEYQAHLRAIVFCVYRCGFYPISALSEDNALDNRLSKIQNLIEGCRYGIHDISRTQLNAAGLPRFNMPFELGIFFGAKRFGDKVQKQKNGIVFESDRYSYQQYISDLNGVDVKSHGNNIDAIIRHIRNWLSTSSRRTTIPGYLTIINHFKKFSSTLPEILVQAELDEVDLPFNDLCLIIEEYLKSFPVKPK